jgi:small-conductance mechanosensitive channel
LGRLWALLTDNQTLAGKLFTTAVLLLAAAIVGAVVGRLLARRAGDPYRSYYHRKVTHYLVAAIAAVALAVLWRPFAGQIGLVLGLLTAGLAFAMQEVIGAVAGWFNILSGGVYRVGDRVQIGEVHGDVIDITPLRTKLMEIGSPDPEKRGTWVHGRQYTGRIVAVSNKTTFTDPVYNYSAVFDFIWEELSLPIPYDQDWRLAERILEEETRAISASGAARAAIAAMVRRYPVPRAEVEPRVFARATDNYLELSARFVVPVREARTLKDRMTRRVLDRLEEAGIPVASTTEDVTIHHAGEPRRE